MQATPEAVRGQKHNPIMEGMSLADYAAVKDIEHGHRDGWGSATALWVLVAAVIIFAIVYNWTKNCNEKVQFATGLSDLAGRVNCIAPQVQNLNAQMYGAAQTFAGLTVGLNESREVFGSQIASLNKTVYYNPVNEGAYGIRRSSCGCGCGSPSRVFAQTQTYTPSSQQVTVTETCGNDRV